MRLSRSDRSHLADWWFTVDRLLLTAALALLGVVKGLLDYVSRHGFSLFAWWRIAVGAAGPAGLLVFG